MKVHFGLGLAALQAKRYLDGFKKTTVRQRPGGLIEVSMESCTMLLTKRKALMVYDEWDRWRRQYMDGFDFASKTVLDIGAGCGETAALFFEIGAKRVICVESDPFERELIRRNAVFNGWEVDIIPDRFRPWMLEKFLFDYFKFDCEGCERGIEFPRGKPGVVIYHDEDGHEIGLKRF